MEWTTLFITCSLEFTCKVDINPIQSLTVYKSMAFNSPFYTDPLNHSKINNV